MFKTMVLIGWTVVCGSLGHILLSKGMQQVGPHLLAALQNPWVIAGILLEVFYFLLWILVLSLAEVSFAVPMSALEYFLVTFMAIFFLHESVAWTRWLGLLFICLGVFFMMQSWDKEGVAE